MTYRSKQLQRVKHEGLCKHNLKICSQCVIITDAARRMADIINERVAFTNSWEARNCWLAFRLDDGSSDKVLYDSKIDAIRHCSDEKYFAFWCFRNAPGGINARDAQIYLDLHRHAYDNGGHLADPDAKAGGPDIMVSTASYDHIRGRAPRSTLIPGVDY
jgi:hypothetical protein